MKIFVKYTAFSMLSLGHDLSTQAASDLPIIPLENTDTTAVLPSMTDAGPPTTNTDAVQTDVRTAFEAEFDAQIRRAVTLFDRIYGRTIDTAPEYLLEVLDDACTFLGDRAPFRINDAESLRVCQSFLRPLESRPRCSIRKPGHFDEYSFVPRFIIPMAGFIQRSSGFLEEQKALAETFFDTSDTRVFEFDSGRFETALANPLVLKFFLLKTLSKCIIDFHVIIKMMLIEQLRGVAIPLSEIDKQQILGSLTSFAVNAAQSPNVLIDGKIASIVHKNIDRLGSDLFLNAIRVDLREYFTGDYFYYLAQACLSDSS